MKVIDDKMRKVFIIILVIVIAFPFSACGKKSKQTAESEKISASQAKSTVVYITETGTKYHKSNCYCLKKSKIKRKLSEVNNYEPCKICCPPVVKE